MWAVEINNLGYIHNLGSPFESRALEDVTVKIKTGTFVGIIGHTGSGKSTLIQHINGLLAPQTGTVKVLGQDLANKKVRSQLWRRVGLVFQYPEQQLFEETVYNDIAFGPKNLGNSEELIKKNVYNALKSVGLPEDILSRPPLSLSGGIKRRVAIAGVLSMEPEILVLDEPTAGMEPRAKKVFLRDIKRLQQKKNLNVILVTHSMEDVARISDQIMVMNNGRVEMVDTPREVFKQAEKLADIGLSVPFEVKLMLKLKQRGFPVPSNVIGLDEAVQEIKRVVK